MKAHSLQLRSSTPLKTILATLCFAGLALTSARADTFGTGPNQFTIGFVPIGNAGNANDAGAGGGSFSSPYGGVSYDYRMGVVELSQDWITKATALGLSNVTAGAWGASQPAANMSWYEAAAFVNWLNDQRTPGLKAYNLTGVTSLTLWSPADAWTLGGENLYRHKDAYYFLPSENEWYKAAYHQNDGVTANFWDYPTGSNTPPMSVPNGTTAGTAVFGNLAPQPAAVDQSGGLSAYGTMGQGGNLYEWLETAADGVNDSSSENRVLRGGDWATTGVALRPAERFDATPSNAPNWFGFRVASVVPEPSSTVLILSASLLPLARRRRRAAL